MIALGSSMVPDADHPKSKASRWLGWAALFSIFSFSVMAAFSSPAFSMEFLEERAGVFVAYVMIGLLVYFLITYFLRKKHRGITHSLFALFLYSAGVFVVSSNLSFSIAALVGYGSHLLADGEIKLV